MLRILILMSMLVPIASANRVKRDYVKTTPVKQSVLKTGWYYISSPKTAYLRQLDQSKEEYYIDPKPIVIAKDFTSAEINDGSYGSYILIKFNMAGTIAWSNATGKSVGKKLALIIGNKLVYTPQVNTQITSGISALNKGSYSDAQLQNLLKQIKSEM